MAWAKQAAARAEERLQRAQLDNLRALGKLSSKSLELDFLEPRNLKEAREQLSLQPSLTLMELDAALRNVVSAADTSGNLRGDLYVRSLKDSTRCETT